MGRPPPKTLPPMTTQRPDIWGQRLRDSQHERYVKDERSLKAALIEARRRQKTFGDAHGFSIILTTDITVKETVVLDVDGLTLRSTSRNTLLATGGLADLLRITGDDVSVSSLQLGHESDTTAQPVNALVFQDESDNQCLRPAVSEVLIYATGAAINFNVASFHASLRDVEIRGTPTSIFIYSGLLTPLQQSSISNVRSFVSGVTLNLNTDGNSNMFADIYALGPVYMRGSNSTATGIISAGLLSVDSNRSTVVGCKCAGFTLSESSLVAVSGLTTNGDLTITDSNSNVFSACVVEDELIVTDSSQNAFSGCYINTSITESGTSGLNAFVGITGTPALTLAATSIGAIGTDAAWNTPAKPAGTIV